MAPDSLGVVKDAVQVCAVRLERGGSDFVSNALLKQWALYISTEVSSLERLRFLRTLPRTAQYAILENMTDESITAGCYGHITSA